MKLPKFMLVIAKVGDGTVLDTIYTDEDPAAVRKALMDGSYWGLAAWDSIDEYQQDDATEGPKDVKRY